ncbi:MAG: O-antigen ligase family protein, partial [Pseudomonadota bacterium]
KKTILFFLLLCITAWFAGTKAPLTAYSVRGHNTDGLIKATQVLDNKSVEDVTNDISYKGDSNRLKILDHVFTMIKEKPVLGHGLGSVMLSQERETGSFIDLMDSTPLWLWAETGLIGLSFFLSFYTICLIRLFKAFNDNENNEITRAFTKGAFMMLLIFGLMSLFHELLYSRFFWLFLGMALAMPNNVHARK